MMSSYETNMLIVAIVGAGLVVLEIAIAIWSVKAEHERRKKQATIEYLRNIRPLYSSLWNDVQNKFGDDLLTEAMVTELTNEHEIRRKIKELLGTLEHASVGMNTGVFDKDLWYRMSASFLIRLYSRLRAYIKHVQKNINPNAYIEFEGIVKEFEARQTKRLEKRGNLRYS